MAYDSPFVLQESTAAAAGTSDILRLPRIDRQWVLQLIGTASFTLEGSIDGTTFESIMTANAGTLITGPTVPWAPYMRLQWSGNAGTIAAYFDHN